MSHAALQQSHTRAAVLPLVIYTVGTCFTFYQTSIAFK